MDNEQPLRIDVLTPRLAHAMVVFGVGVKIGPPLAGCSRRVTWIERHRDDRSERWELRPDGNYHLVSDTAGD